MNGALNKFPNGKEECKYLGEKFEYPDWVQDIKDGISLFNFLIKYEGKFPKQRGFGSTYNFPTWGGDLVGIEISIYIDYHRVLQLLENNISVRLIDLLNKSSRVEIEKFVEKTRGKTNNEGRFQRGGVNNTTDQAWRNDLVCLADLSTHTDNNILKIQTQLESIQSRTSASLS